MFKMINYHHEMAALRAYAGKAGLTMKVVDDPKCQTAFTDGKALYVPAPKVDWDDIQWLKWKFLCYHEAGHNKAPCDDLFPLMRSSKWGKGGAPFGFWMNILDDYRQEHVHNGEYSGRDAAVSIGRALFEHEIIATINDAGKGLPSSCKEEKVNSALFIWSDRNRPDWQPDMKGVAELMYDMADPEVQEWADKLKDYDDQLNDALTAINEERLLELILKEVFEYEESEIEEAKTPTAGTGDGDPSDETGSPGDGSEASKDDESDSNGTAVMSWRDVIPHDHESKTPSTGDLTILFDDWSYRSGGAKGTVDPNPKIADPDKKGPGHRSIKFHSISSLTNRLRKLLRVKSQTRWIGHQPKGKLSSRDLFRVVTDNDDFDVFKRKTSDITLNSAVTIVIDLSGSMGGKKWGHAANACYQLYAGLTKLRIPLEIIGFASDDTDLFIPFKAFNERVSEDKLKDRLQNYGPHAANEDAAAILFAAERLMKRKEPGKIMIVLSDGQPAGYNLDSMSFCVAVVRRIERNSPINIMGIGIMDDTVKRIYKEHAVIKDSDQLEDALINIIKRKFLT